MSRNRYSVFGSPITDYRILITILLLATFLRFWRLDALPPGLYHDEAYNGLDALSLLQGRSFPLFYEGWELYATEAHAGRPPQPTRWPVFFEGNYGREPLHIYLMALSIRLFGATPFAIRAVPAAAGVLAVLTTYLAARVLLNGGKGQRAGPLIAAFIMAILYPALTFSRFGIRPMLFVSVETLCVYCFWRGVNSIQSSVISNQYSVDRLPISDHRLPNTVLWFIAAGFFLGLGLYTYAAARLLPLLFLLFVPLWFWRDRAARPAWPAVVGMVVAALLTAAPLLLFFARYPYFFVFRIAYVANRGLGTVADKPWLTWLGNVGRVIAGLFWQGEGHLRHNLPGRPYLDPVQAVFFVAGLVTLLRQRSLRDWFLLLWLVVMLLPTILSGDAPHFGRMTGAAPVAAIVIAAGISAMVSRLQVAKGRRRTAVRLVIVLLLAGSALLTIRDYFGRYAGHPELAEAFYQDDWQLGQVADRQPGETALYLSSHQAEMATIYFALDGELDRIRSYADSGTLIPLGWEGRPSLYFLRPEAESARRGLVEFFGEGGLGQPVAGYIPFMVPADAPRVRNRLTDVALGGGIALAGWDMEQASDELRVTLTWQAKGLVVEDYTAYVHLLDESGELVAQRDRPPEGYPTSQWRPGELVRDVFVIPVDPALPPGEYQLQTGFYELSSLARTGEPAPLGTVAVGE